MTKSKKKGASSKVVGPGAAKKLQQKMKDVSKRLKDEREEQAWKPIEEAVARQIIAAEDAAAETAKMTGKRARMKEKKKEKKRMKIENEESTAPVTKYNKKQQNGHDHDNGDIHDEGDDSWSDGSASGLEEEDSPMQLDNTNLQVETVEEPEQTGAEIVANAMDDQTKRASELLAWLIHPITVEQFYEEYYEKKPLLVKRKNRNYYDGWLSKDDIDTQLRRGLLSYSKDIDITSYKNGKRSTLNPEGVATADHVWKMYGEGCSMRMLHPQTTSKRIWKLLSLLEEEFGCMVGANVYLTPANSQGFAPHFDDIEAFLMQLEGSKHWRVYQPRNEDEVLARISSPNFDQSEIGEPILDAVVESGDLLYFPRGYIHQGVCGGEHSLHLTASTGHTNSWLEYLEMALARAVILAADEHVDIRRSLPRNYLNYMGSIHANAEDDAEEGGEDTENHNEEKAKLREEFAATAKRLAEIVVGYLPHDAAADQMSRKFLYDRLPIPLAKNCDTSPAGLTGDTMVRMTSKWVARVVGSDQDEILLAHCMDNDRLYHQAEPQEITFPVEDADALEHLINRYPQWTRIGDLPCEDGEAQMGIASALLEAKLATKKDKLDKEKGKKKKNKAH